MGQRLQHRCDKRQKQDRHREINREPVKHPPARDRPTSSDVPSDTLAAHARTRGGGSTAADAVGGRSTTASGGGGMARGGSGSGTAVPTGGVRLPRAVSLAQGDTGSADGWGAHMGGSAPGAAGRWGPTTGGRGPAVGVTGGTASKR